MRHLPLYGSSVSSPLEIEQPLDIDHNCSKCKLSAALTKRPGKHTVCIASQTICENIPAEGLPPGGLLVVGESPGKTEDEKGVPFVGKTGEYLRSIIHKFWNGNVTYDHAIRCFPGINDKLESPSEACRGYLAQTLKEVQPSRILVLGAWAIHSVLGRSSPPFSVRKGYGWVNKIPAFTLIHPAAALRNRFIRGWFESDIKWALTCETPQLPPFDSQVRIVESILDALQAEEEIRSCEWVAFDTETFGRMFTDLFEVISVSFCCSGSSKPIVWSYESIKDSQCKEVLKRILHDSTIKKYAQNFKYDAQAVWLSFGVEVNGFCGDTYLWRRIIDAEAKANLDVLGDLVGLGGHKNEAEDSLSVVVKDLRKWVKDEEEKPYHIGTKYADEEVRNELISGADEKSFAYGYIPTDILYRYNALDALVNADVGTLLGNQISKNETSANVWSKMVMPAILAVRQVERWGIAVSKESIDSFDFYLKSRMDDISRRFKTYGDFNPDSPKQVSELLFEKLKLTAVKITNTGKTSTDKQALEALRLKYPDNPIIGDLIAWRKYAKLKGTYVDGLRSYVRPDGRIHPNFNIDGARTGRFSCDSPNLFNLPRAQSEEGKRSRDVFVSPPGKLLVEGDFSQLELRVAAMISKDPNMKELFVKGGDFHLQIAKYMAPMVWKIKPEEVKDTHRSIAKVFVFGVIYGMSDEGIVARTNCTKNEAAMIRQAIMGKFYVLDQWIKKKILESAKDGECWTWWDGDKFRRRPLWRIASQDYKERVKAEHGSFNTTIQGTASDFCLASFIHLTNWMVDENKGDKLVLSVYDSLMAEVDEDRVEVVANKMREVMTSFSSFGVPLEVDFKVGTSWGSMKKL